MTGKNGNLLVISMFLTLCALAIQSAALRTPSEVTPADIPAAAGVTPTVSLTYNPATTLVVEMHSSDGKRDWLDAVTTTFNARHVQVAGKTVVVKTVHMRSGESLQRVLDGKDHPTLWSPASDSWTALLNQRWARLHGRNLMDRTVPTVKTALVVAMWDPMARSLGWPQRSLGWGDLIGVAIDPAGWGAHGHPEWGRFRFGHAHPDFSTSAMQSIITVIYAAAGKARGLTPADLQNPRVVQQLQALESSVVHYGESSSWLTEKLCTRGPGYLSAVTLYESSVVRANLKYPAKPFPLVAMYPKEGTFWEQHPTGIMNGDWVTDEQREAAQIYLDYLSSRDAQVRSWEFGFRPTMTGLPAVAPFDLAHGVDPAQNDAHALADVSDEVFERANELWHSTRKKSTVVLVLDISGSMNGPKLEAAKHGAELFVKRMEPDDMIQVVAFSTTARPLGPMVRVRDGGEDLVKRIRGLYAEGETRLYDTTLDALHTIDLERHQQPGRLFGVVLLTDGVDNASHATRTDLMAHLPGSVEADGTRVFTIGYGGDADVRLLQEIAGQSNALAFKGTEADVEKIYVTISAYF